MADNNENSTPPAAPVPQTEPIIDEVAEARKQAALERQKREQLERDLADAKAQGLKSKDDWKGLAELNEIEANNLRAENTRIKGAIVSQEKYKVLAAEAVKLGINPVSIPDLELLDFTEVTTETLANGKVIVSGAAAAIGNLKRLRPNWFTGDVPNVNPMTPQGSSNQPNGNVSLDMVIAAQEKWSKSKSDSDKAAYEKMIRQYKGQN
jgi:hypothetical protein